MERPEGYPQVEDFATCSGSSRTSTSFMGRPEGYPPEGYPQLEDLATCSESSRTSTSFMGRPEGYQPEGYRQVEDVAICSESSRTSTSFMGRPEGYPPEGYRQVEDVAICSESSRTSTSFMERPEGYPQVEDIATGSGSSRSSTSFMRRPEGYPPEGYPQVEDIATCSESSRTSTSIMERPEGYPPVEDIASCRGSSRTSTSFMGTENDMSLLESGLLRRNASDIGDKYYRFQSRTGKSVGPKMLALVEFFRELYFRRLEVFKKIFPAGHDKLTVEARKKLGAVLAQVKPDQVKVVRTMQRSLSVGSPRVIKGDESELRLERFKVKTFDVDGGVIPGGQGESGGSK